jgi:predicted nucleic acid-binding protein
MTRAARVGARLIDSNILVYRFDRRFPLKQAVARQLLRGGIEAGDLCVSFQAIVEFVAVATRGGSQVALLAHSEAQEQVDKLLAEVRILYPTASLLRIALQGCKTYRLSWFDALNWAYAEFYGCAELLTEDLQHGALIGSVIVRNPFHAVQEGIA